MPLSFDSNNPDHQDPHFWEDPPHHYRHAITWKLVADVMARHVPRKDLRVFELHPAGGMGDTLSMRLVDERSVYGAELNDFRAWRRMGNDGEGRSRYALPDGGYYIRSALKEDTYHDTLLGILHALGLEEGRSPVDPHGHPRVLTHYFMAEVLAHGAKDERAWQWRSGMEDTSGYSGTGPRKAFDPEHPHFHHILRHLPLERRGQNHPLYDIWFLTIREHYNPDRDNIQLIVDAATGFAWLNAAPPGSQEESSTETAFDLRDALAKHGTLERLTAWAWGFITS
jgi:hypothetical protein